MLDSVKDKLRLPLIFAASVIIAANVGLFIFFSASPAWVKFLPIILAVAGFVGGLALTYVPKLNKYKILPVIAVTVAAIITGIVAAIL